MSPRPKDTMDTFGKVIARLLNEQRLQKGITQTELADATGISQSQISKQLRGTRDINIDELGSIADALGLPLVSLIQQAEREMNPDSRDDLAARRAGAPVSEEDESVSETHARLHAVNAEATEDDEDMSGSDDSMRYAANRRRPEPEEGDDDYGPGA